jgi:hypothetical protein
MSLSRFVFNSDSLSRESLSAHRAGLRPSYPFFNMKAQTFIRGVAGEFFFGSGKRG